MGRYFYLQGRFERDGPEIHCSGIVLMVFFSSLEMGKGGGGMQSVGLMDAGGWQIESGRMFDDSSCLIAGVGMMMIMMMIQYLSNIHKVIMSRSHHMQHATCNVSYFHTSFLSTSTSM